jgi:hypothetical protein
LIGPGAAIERAGQSAEVVRFSAGRLERRPVETGRHEADGKLVEIRSGLALGDTIVLGVSRSVPSGAAARVGGTRTDAATVTPIAR